MSNDILLGSLFTISKITYSMLRVLLFVSVASLSVLTSCATSNSSFSTPNTVYTITTTLSGNISPARGVTLQFKGKGKLQNAVVKGNDTKIIAENTSVIFQNCRFAGTFINSSLYATNFGCTDNLSKKSFVWKYGDGKLVTKAKVGQYVASDRNNNKTALNSIAMFCSNSRGVSIQFNGSFYTPVVDNDGGRGNNVMTIIGARNLTLHGGCLLQGLVFYNCEDVDISSMKFVGQHEPHDFPPIFTESKNLTNNKVYNKNNSYNIGVNQFAACGLAPEAIYIKVNNGGESKNFNIHDCSFEMRQNGVITGLKGRTNNIHHIYIKDCSFSHIYFQPVGFHGSYNFVDNIVSDYCLMGFDFSSGTNNSEVKNSKFYNCAIGPKQETKVTADKGHYDSYGNKVADCYYQINEKIKLVDFNRHIFYASEGRDGDFFTLNDMTFDVEVTKAIPAIQCRAYGMNINNLKLILNCPKTGYIFSPNGKTNYTPIINIDGAEIVCNGTIEVFAKSSMQMNINNLKLIGMGSISDVAFRSLKSLNIRNSRFTLPCNYFTQMTPNVTMSNSTIDQVKRIAFFPANSGQASFSFDLNGCTVNAGTSLFWAANTSQFKLNAMNNTFRTGSVIIYDKNVMKSDVNMRGNNLIITGKNAFSGMKNVSSQISKNNFKVQGNKISLSGSSQLFDFQGGNINSKLLTGNTY